MDGASKLQMRELRRVAKFVLDIKNLGLHIVPTMYDHIWHLEALSDSDFANDKETRVSVYGYIVIFCGVTISWKSRVCCHLRSSEGNQVSLSTSDILRYLYLSRFKWTMWEQFG